MIMSCWMFVFHTLLLLLVSILRLVMLFVIVRMPNIAGYSSLAKDSGCRFVPFAFESFGSLGPAGVAFLRDLESYAKESFLPFHYYSSFSSLAVLLQKGNAEMLAQGVVMVSKSVIQ